MADLELQLKEALKTIRKLEKKIENKENEAVLDKNENKLECIEESDAGSEVAND